MMENTIKIAPSILSADFRKLEHELNAIEDAGADMIHCDIMDGCFVPNITIGPFIVEFVKKCVSIPLDVHLMIVNPQNYVKQFRSAGADIITAHAEACSDLPSVIALIRESGARVGVTVNPDKPVELFLPLLDTIDLVLIMSVFAGFSGQKFIPQSVEKIRQIYSCAQSIGHPIEIEVDGGINAETVISCAANGATAFVAGSYVFGGKNYRERIESVRQGALSGRKNLAK